MEPSSIDQPPAPERAAASPDHHDTNDINPPGENPGDSSQVKSTSLPVGSVFDDDEDNNPFGFIQDHADAPGKDIDASMLLYSSGRKESYNTVKMNYELRVTKMLLPSNTVSVHITEAGSSNEGMNNLSKKYVVYTIKLVDPNNEEIQTRRRYSDFESLRDVLTRIFPLVIVPPIPPKNYLSLGVLNGLVGTNGSGTQQNKTKLVEGRKRLLSNFLNNCLNIPQIRHLEFFAKFLDPNANWLDEIALITRQLPKSVYSLNPENGLKSDALYEHLPHPVGTHIPQFLKLLDKKKIASRFRGKDDDDDAVSPPDEASVNTRRLDDINKKIMDSFVGMAADYTELGTAFNSCSLIVAGPTKKETDRLDLVFDHIGQVFDRSYITINALITDLETKFSEPLGEAVQYSQILHDITKYADRKVRQKSMLDQDVGAKKAELAELKRFEEEGARLESANPPQKYDLTSAAPAKGKFKLPNITSFKKIGQYVSDIIDQNPDQTRKQKITTLESKIDTLQKCQTIMLEDVSYIADEMDKNLKRFHNRELKVIYRILISYNGVLLGWAKKNLEIWEEIREQVIKL